MVFCFQVNYTTNQTPLSGHRTPPFFAAAIRFREIADGESG
jgi:hypothetical protein